MGVMGFARSKGNTFLEDICKRACATSRKPSYGQIKMLAKAADAKAASPRRTRAKDDTGIGDSGMVRGADYYRLD
jgi:hypothetical protein